MTEDVRRGTNETWLTEQLVATRLHKIMQKEGEKEKLKVKGVSTLLTPVFFPCYILSDVF